MPFLRNTGLWVTFAVSACKSPPHAVPVLQPHMQQPAPTAAQGTVSDLALSRTHVCGALPCEQFASPELAFARVLAERPTVLGVGETHAPQGAEDVPSATVRFIQALLPMLAPKASDLVLELWVANAHCSVKQRAQIHAVATAQRDVTQTQAPSNQSDFMRLFMSARAQQLGAHVLIPACEEYGRILAAGTGAGGASDIDAMLQLVARLTEEKIASVAQARAHERDGKPTEDSGALARGSRMIVAYGGAMHNDATPPAGRERWSYGAAVAKQSEHYVELDLIVPEFVKDTEAWRAQPWYPHFTRGAQGTKTVLYTLSPRSFVLVFPETHSAARDAGGR
jgi:hypothetical protein